jgi:hypothetical protein
MSDFPFRAYEFPVKLGDVGVSHDRTGNLVGNIEGLVCILSVETPSDLDLVAALDIAVGVLTQFSVKVILSVLRHADVGNPIGARKTQVLNYPRKTSIETERTPL